jgi:predicted amidophosphoribosyltransferase
LVYAANALQRVRPVPELKSLDEATDRDQILSGAFAADESAVRGRTVLLIDDVFRSGATLREGWRALDEAGAAAVYALVATRTRVKR